MVGAAGRLARISDGGSLEVRTVVWATGYRSDYSWIHIADVVDDGRVVHRRGVADVPGLYFLGLPWQHTRGSALLGFVDEDAAHIARAIQKYPTAARAEAVAR
jgi:putative flavoprotein involved in K+ transport